MREVFSVGRRIRSAHDLDVLPVEAVVSDGNYRWVKESNDAWVQEGYGVRWTPYDFALNGHVKIVSFPDGAESFGVPQPTVEQVKWQFRVGALAAAATHGVGIATVEDTLRVMGCGIDDVAPTLGRGVKVPINPDRESRNASLLPDGSVVFQGTPHNPASLSVYMRKAGRWVLILGERDHPEGEAVIESVNGNREPPEWLSREGTNEDLEKIGEFKARAWRVGWKLKQSQGWCSTYESIVHRLGVTQADTQRSQYRGLGIGDRITAAEAMRLPIRSLLWWQHSDAPERWALFIRDDGSANAAGTLRVAGSGESHENYRRYMTVASIANEDGNTLWPVPENPPGVWEALPPGTVFSYRQGGEAEYIKCRDGRTIAAANTVIPERGNYLLHQFGTTPEFHVRRIVR
jgi:hypothetical protein